MKRTLTIFVMTMLAVFATAQDLIVAKQGDPVKAWNIEISEKYVFYTAAPDEDASILRMAKEDILMIRKADGTVVNLTAPTAATTPVATPVETSATIKPSDKSIQENADRIKAYNAFKVEFTGKKSFRDAPRGLFTLGLSELSVLQDDNLSLDVAIGEVTFDNGKAKFSKTFRKAMGYRYFLNQALLITLTNKTTKTIYIDLASSFYKRGTEASAYYVPSAVSNTNSSTAGGGIGIPTIFGVVGVGGSKTHAVTVTTYSQRIIAIPPRSTKALEAEMLFPKDFAGIEGISVDYSQSRMGYYPITNIGDATLNIGDQYTFTETTSPVSLEAYITYGFDENFTQSGNLFVDLYARECTGFPYPSGAAAFCANPDKHFTTTGQPLVFITVLDDDDGPNGVMRLEAQ